MATESKRIKAVFEADTSKYNSSLTGINKQMKMYQSEVKAASADTKNFGKNGDSLSKTQQALSKQVELCSQKIKIYEDNMYKSNKKIEEGVAKRKDLEKQLASNKTKYDELIKTEGKNSEQAKTLKADIDKLSKEYDKNEKSIDSNIKKTADYQTQINNTKATMSNMEGQLDKTNRALNEHTNKWNQASDKMNVFSEKAKNVGSGLNTVGNGMLKVFTPMAVGIGAATKQFMEFESQMKKINTIADYSKISFEEVKDGIVDLSYNTGVATNDLNEALYQAMSAGVDTADSIGFLDEAVKLAKGGFTSTTQAVNILTTVLNAYGLEASETAKISDILVQTQNLGKTSVDELSGALGKVIPTAKAANVNFEQLGAAMAIMTAKGISTNESVTYLNSAINELSKSGTKASDALKNATGKSFQELMESGVSLGDVMNELDKYAKQSGLSLNDMFGSAEAGKAALTIATDSGKEFNSLLKDMENSAGSTQAAYEEMMSSKSENLSVSLNKMKIGFMKLGEAAVPIVDEIAKIISKLADFIGNLSDEQLASIVNFTKWGLIIGGSTKIAGTGVNAVAGLTSGFSKFAGMMGKTTTATAATGATMTTTAGSTSFLTKAFTLGTKAINPYTLALTGITLAGAAIADKMNDDVVPAVDLYTERIEKSADGTFKSVEKISEATQQAVDAYVKMDDNVQKSLLNMKMTTTGITSEMANDTINQFSNMGKTIKGELDKDYKEQLGIMQNFFTSTSILSAEEQAKSLQLLNTHYDTQKATIESANARITEIVTTASNQNRAINQSEYEEINSLRVGMRDVAVTALSETEAESKIIAERLSAYDGRVTAEMAGEHVRLLEEQRIKAIDTANREYNEKIAVAELMRQQGGAEAKMLSDKMIEEAEIQRSGVVDKANRTKEEGIDKLSESYSKLRETVNTDTGDILDYWEALFAKWNSWNPDPKTFQLNYKENWGISGNGGPRDYNNPNGYSTRSISNIRNDLRKISMPSIPDITRLSSNSSISYQQKVTPFDYDQLKDIVGGLSSKLDRLNQTIKISIDGRALSSSISKYIDEDLAGNMTSESYGFSKI